MPKQSKIVYYLLFVPRTLLRIARLSIIIIIISCLLVLRSFVVPLIPHSFIKRYVQSLVNLVGLRIVLLILGYLSIRHENINYLKSSNIFKIFRQRDQYYKHLRFGSGSVAVSNSIGLAGFFQFGRIVYYHQPQGDKIKILIQILPFYQALKASLRKDGFNPVVLKNKKQYKQISQQLTPLGSFLQRLSTQHEGSLILFIPNINQKKLLSIPEQIQTQMKTNMMYKYKPSIAFYLSQKSQKDQDFIQSFKDLYNKCGYFSYNCLQVFFSHLEDQDYILGRSHFLFRIRQSIKIVQFYEKKGFQFFKGNAQEFNKAQILSIGYDDDQAQDQISPKQKNKKKKKKFVRSNKADK